MLITPNNPELAAAYLAGNLSGRDWTIEYRSGRTGELVNKWNYPQSDVFVFIRFGGEKPGRKFCIGERTVNARRTRGKFTPLNPPFEVKNND